jgi:hypothetical protein
VKDASGRSDGGHAMMPERMQDSLAVEFRDVDAAAPD